MKRGPKPGTVFPLAYANDKIREEIRTIGETQFRPRDITRKTGCSRANVDAHLSKLLRAGYLKKLRRGLYVTVGQLPATDRLPQSFIAEHVWQVIKKSKEFLTQPEIARLVSCESRIKLEIISHGVAGILSNWYKNDYLERIEARLQYKFSLGHNTVVRNGTKKFFAYRLKPDIVKRPATSRRYFILSA